MSDKTVQAVEDSLERVVRPRRPSAREEGILLAAKWLIEYGEPRTAAYLLKDMGVAGLDISRMEEQDREALEKLSVEGIEWPNDEAHRSAGKERGS